MSTVVGALSIDLSASSAAFAADMGKAQAALRSSGAQMNRTLATMERGWDKLRGGFNLSLKDLKNVKGGIAGLVAATGVGSIVALGKASIESAANIARVADKVGITAKALQEYRYMAKTAGVDQATLDMGMQRFVRRLGEAAQGGGELLPVLKQYGIQIQEADGRTRDVNAVLDDFADVVATSGSRAEQLRLAFKGFDSEGAVFVNFLRNGSAGLAQLRQEANDLGLVLDEKLVREAERAQRQIDIMAAAVKTNAVRAFVSFVPAVLRVAATLKSAIPSVVAFVNSWLPASLSGPEELTRRIAELEERAKGLASMLSDAPGDRVLSNSVTEQLAAIEEQIATLKRFKTEAQQAEEAAKAAVAGMLDTHNPQGTTIFENFTKATERRIDALRTETSVLGENEGVQARVMALQQITTELKEKNAVLDTEQTERLAQQLGTLEAVTNQQIAAKRAHEESREALRDLGQIGATALQGLIMRTSSAADVMQNLLTAIAELIFKLTVVKELEALLDSQSGGSSGSGIGSAVVRGFMNGIAGYFTGGFDFGGLFGGGAVQSDFGSMPTMSAASGASFEVGGRGGTDANSVMMNLTRGEQVNVLTADQQRAQGGGIAIHQSFDFRGAEPGVFARAEKFKEEVKKETLAALYAAINSGGKAAQIVGRRRKG